MQIARPTPTQPRNPATICILLLLILAAATYRTSAAEVQRQFHFISADFLTSRPNRVGWLDEETVIFSVGGGVTILGTGCWPEAKRGCNQNRSIQLWDLKTNRITIFMEESVLHCIAGGRMTVVKGTNFHTGPVEGPLEDTGLGAAGNYDWDRCTPTRPVTTVKEDGATVFHLKQSWDYYDFRGAYFRAMRYGSPRATVFWKTPNGLEERKELPDGPWNLSDRLWESYTPTKVGVIIADRPHNYWVDSDGYGKFFPGSISSVIGVSPSGCQVSFFGAKFYDAPRRTEVRLYATRVC
jgi:hypothetical protein